MKIENVFKLTLLLLVFLVSACSTKLTIQPTKVKSPFGIYKSNTTQKYWVEILQKNEYKLCSIEECFKGVYENIPASYGVILIDFYTSETGLKIEKVSHGKTKNNQFYSAMKIFRLSQHRPNDLAFNIGDCNGTPCVGIGHTRNGIKFLKAE